jgi:uncharacterized membrane protein YidH (DUF202 family)
MRAFRTVVVAVVLCAMFSPGASALAKSEPRAVPAATETVPLGETLARVASTVAAGGLVATANEASQYAQREQQSQDVQNFRGGAVYVYFGSGLVLALVIILLILII